MMQVMKSFQKFRDSYSGYVEELEKYGSKLDWSGEGVSEDEEGEAVEEE